MTPLKGWANAETTLGSALDEAVQREADLLAAHLALAEARLK